MHVLITRKLKMVQINRNREKVRWQHHFFRRSRAGNSVISDWIWPNFKLIQALMYVIITCKYQKDLIKKKLSKSGNTVFPIISLCGFFLDTQGQLTLQSVVRSGQISNFFELSCMSSLPVSMKKYEK